MQASTSEKIVTYSALVLSVSAVIISLFEVYTMRKQTKADAWPNLNIYYQKSFTSLIGNDTYGLATGDSVYAFYITNVGVGPARMENLFMWIDGKPIRTNEEWYTTLGLDSLPDGQWLARTHDVTYPPGYEMWVFLSQDPRLRAKMLALAERIEVGACYSSVYGDRFSLRRTLTTSGDITHAPCDECPWPASQALLLTEKDMRR